LINLLNPEAIIIAGGFAARAGDLLIKPLLNGIKAKTLPWIKDDINIIQSELGEYIAARGAAAIALDKSFDDLF
jgi:predicted NBD/HSP70 family sugar kinase